MPILDTAIFQNIELERRRFAQRKDGRRLVFDCFSATCQEDRVKCSAGHPLGIASDGKMTLMTVLKGRPCSPFCEDYDDGGTFGD